MDTQRNDEIVNIYYPKSYTYNNWRLLTTGRNSGAFNMALDEALLQNFSGSASFDPTTPPILRFYGWHPACLSLGYAQNAEREINFGKCQNLGIDWVRRPTGGRAILHDYTELTYSLVASINDPVFGNGILESYRVISGALLDGLRILGVQADIAPKTSSKKLAQSTAACFEASSSYEVTVSGRKLIGSAQTRRSGVFLQQGTILLAVDVEKLFEVINLSHLLHKEQAIEQVSQRLTSLELILGRSVTFAEAQKAFLQGFANHFSIDFSPSTPSAEELDLTNQLLLSKYGDLEWNLQRQRPTPILHG